jgi:hypothetical protein
MEERTVLPGASEHAPPPTREAAAAADPGHLGDPRALPILTTEHWSLLTARSLVYNEAFARAGMFLTFLTGTLVALGFVSQGSGFGSEFMMVAAALLGFDLFIGLATLGRISSASTEEFRALQGMNRLRHAYLEMVPSLEPYFSTSPHDDLLGVLSIYGATRENPSLLGSYVHGLTTTPGMVAMITCAVAGAFAGAVALLVGASPTPAIAIGLAAFVVAQVAIWIATTRRFDSINRTLEVRFPTPTED